MPNLQLNIDSCFTLFLNHQSLFSIPHSPLATCTRRGYYVNNSSLFSVDPELISLILGLTHTLRILGVLGVLAVRQIKLLGDFCVSPKFIFILKDLEVVHRRHRFESWKLNQTRNGDFFVGS
ncbi:hypothetical protein [Nostoc sp.]|uniref:hypothetical protein n=1 Tax=Nostoc sp. TaxID=1180 RepID=UPI002FF7DC71